MRIRHVGRESQTRLVASQRLLNPPAILKRDRSVEMKQRLIRTRSTARSYSATASSQRPSSQSIAPRFR